MQLKGLSKYDVRFTDDGEVRVYSLHFRRYIPPIRRDKQEKWQLQDDCGHSRHVTEGQLRFMRKHPDVPAWAISCRATGIKFRRDGTVANLYGGERGRSYARFTSAQDALSTVLFLMQAADGDKVPLLRFVEEARENAVVTVSRLLGCGQGTVARHFEAAADRFVRETRTFNVERIMPLFAWLCKCLKYVVVENRNVKITYSGKMERFGDGKRN